MTTDTDDDGTRRIKTQERGECSHGCGWEPQADPGSAERNMEILEHKIEEHDGELVPSGGR